MQVSIRNELKDTYLIARILWLSRYQVSIRYRYMAASTDQVLSIWRWRRDQPDFDQIIDIRILPNIRHRQRPKATKCWENKQQWRTSWDLMPLLYPKGCWKLLDFWTNTTPVILFQHNTCFIAIIALVKGYEPTPDDPIVLIVLHSAAKYSQADPIHHQDNWMLSWVVDWTPKVGCQRCIIDGKILKLNQPMGNQQPWSDHFWWISSSCCLFRSCDKPIIAIIIISILLIGSVDHLWLIYSKQY